jgi:hypothetical protein
MNAVKYCLIVGLVLALPLASAYADDASYCAALGASYRKYVGFVQADANAAAAMSQCSAGWTAAGIPALEKVLTDNKVKLPARN